MINRETLRIGDTVYLPVYPEKELMAGTVIYINGNRTWYRVEFVTESGYKVIECFPFFGKTLPQ